MLVRLATLSHGRDGFQLHVDRVPLWAWAVGYVGERVVLDTLCPATRHSICGPPEWAFRLGIGTDPYPDPDLRHEHRWSLGGGLSWLGQHYGYRVADKHTKAELVIPLNEDQAALLEPKWVAEVVEMLEETDPDVSVDAARWDPHRTGQ